MDYKEALKQVQSHKQKENYLVVKISYDIQIVLPHSDGIALLNSLKNAEQLHTPYNEPHRIKEIERSKLEVTQMSATEYERFKIAALLGISPAEVLEYAQKAA